jgi:hypothetical protein
MYNMVYYYSITYDENKNEFFGMVHDKNREDIPFTIDNTKQMVSYLLAGYMLHIDDSEGLEETLKQWGVIQAEDTILLVEEALI